METVHESHRPAATSPVLETERLRLQMNVKKAAEDVVPPMRGVRRLKSSNARMLPQRTRSMQAAAQPLAPTKSTDALASMRGSAAARANSSRALLRATSSNGLRPRAPPARANSAQAAGIRPYSRDKIVNTSLAGKSNDNMLAMQRSMQRGPGGTLQRHESDVSLGEFSGDGSLFTMDSVTLRKGQLVADPVEEGTYNEEASFADHESFVTRESDADFFRTRQSMQNPQAPVLTFDDIQTLRLTQRLQISRDDSVMSFGTMASGLTTDFTEDHDDSEYACDETEYAE